MIISEIVLLKELTIDLAQALIDSKRSFDLKSILNQRKFDGLFIQLYYATVFDTRISSKQRSKKFFDFLGKKINAPNKDEYFHFIKSKLREHFKNNGLIKSK